MRKILAFLICVLMLFSIMPQQNTYAAATAACEGNTLGTFNGIPACVNADGHLHICENNFPDANFRAFARTLIKADYYTGTRVWFWQTDASTDPANRPGAINDLTGIEYFQSESAMGHFAYNNVDLKKDLDISLNKGLSTGFQIETGAATGGAVPDNGTKITAKDLPAIIFFSASGVGINKVIIDNCPKLDDICINYNQLTEIDSITNCPLVWRITCDHNKIENVDISSFPKLTAFLGYNNALKSIKLPVSIERVSLQENPDLKTFDASTLVNLIQINLSNTGISELDLSKNLNLELITATDNHLAYLNLDKQTKLTRVQVQRQTIDPIKITKQADGSYTADLSAVVGDGNIQHIDSTSVGSYDPGTGILTFPSRPTWRQMQDFKYYYSVKNSAGNQVAYMDVAAKLYSESSYKVEHYQQNIADDNYTLAESQELIGETYEHRYRGSRRL